MAYLCHIPLIRDLFLTVAYMHTLKYLGEVPLELINYHELIDQVLNEAKILHMHSVASTEPCQSIVHSSSILVIVQI